MFRPSKSPFSAMLSEYTEAEYAGRGKSGASECWPYMKDCPKSLFIQRHNHYRFLLNRNILNVNFYCLFPVNILKKMKILSMK